MPENPALPRGVVLDPTGTPILPVPPEAPQEEPIGGVFSGAIDRSRTYPSRDLTGSKITATLEAADQGEPAEFVELCQEVLEKDPKFGNLIATRKGAVLGLQHGCIPAKLEDEAPEADQLKADEVAKFCQAALDRTNFLKMLKNQLSYLWFPFAVDWIVWSFDERNRIVPLRFLPVPPRHIRWDSKTDRIRLVDLADPRVLAQAELGELLPPFTTVRSIAQSRPDHPTRSGLARTLIWYYHFKIVALKNWVAFAERHGMPVRALFLPTDQIKDPAIVAQMQTFLRQLGTNASGIFSMGSDLKMIESAATRGTSVYKELVDHVNKEAAGLVLGHELSSESAPGQGQLGITAAMQVKQDILEEDCQDLSETIKRDILEPMTLWNFGFDAGRFTPVYWFDYEPDKDLRAEAEVLNIISRTLPGFEFSEQQIRDIWGYERPIDEEDTVAGAGGGQPPEAIPAGFEELPLAAAIEHRRPRPSQKSLAKLQRRGVDRSLPTFAGWRGVIRSEVRAAVAGEEQPETLIRRLVHLYPKLDAEKLEEHLKRAILQARLFGRVSSRK